MLLPNLSLSEERSAKAAERCRREWCNARQSTNPDSFNLNAEKRVRRSTAAQQALLRRPALHHSRRSPFFTGSRRPLLGQGEVGSTLPSILFEHLRQIPR